MTHASSHRHPSLRRADLAADPIDQFRDWFEQAREVTEMPEAMALATCDADGPDARMVLLKGVSGDGFTFFTNYGSNKAGQLEADPRAALVFHWKPLDRQVRVRGRVERIPAADSDAYFATRSRPSRLGAWASPQSRPIADRRRLDALLVEATARFGEDDPVPRPPHWGGFLLRPVRIEFWQGRPARLHDRFAYRLEPGGDREPVAARWRIERLAP